MNIPVIREWVHALRSGNYKQTTGTLRDGGGFCCLGVVTDIAVQKGLGQWIQDEFSSSGRYEFNKLNSPNRQSGNLEGLTEWLGITGPCGEDFCDNSPYGHLATYNDRDGKTFLQIADIIESKIKQYMITTQKAVENVIQGYISDGMAFSAHDVTTKVRKQVNDFEIDIIDAPSSTEGHPRHIAHDTIRNLVAQVAPTLNLQKVWAGNHWEYQTQNPVVAVGVVAPLSNSVTTSTPVDMNNIKTHAVAYIKSKKAQGWTPTLKQVQSTLKRVGHVTCKELCDILVKEGYSFQNSGSVGQYSKYIIV